MCAYISTTYNTCINISYTCTMIYHSTKPRSMNVADTLMHFKTQIRGNTIPCCKTETDI